MSSGAEPVLVSVTTSLTLSTDSDTPPTSKRPNAASGGAGLGDGAVNAFPFRQVRRNRKCAHPALPGQVGGQQTIRSVDVPQQAAAGIRRLRVRNESQRAIANDSAQGLARLLGEWALPDIVKLRRVYSEDSDRNLARRRRDRECVAVDHRHEPTGGAVQVHEDCRHGR